MPVDLIWIWSSPIEGSSIVLVSWDVVSFYRICMGACGIFIPIERRGVHVGQKR
jgi:hypothetical protein